MYPRSRDTPKGRRAKRRRVALLKNSSPCILNLFHPTKIPNNPPTKEHCSFFCGKLPKKENLIFQHFSFFIRPFFPKLMSYLFPCLSPPRDLIFSSFLTKDLTSLVSVGCQMQSAIPPLHKKPSRIFAKGACGPDVIVPDIPSGSSVLNKKKDRQRIKASPILYGIYLIKAFSFKRKSYPFLVPSYTFLPHFYSP